MYPGGVRKKPSQPNQNKTSNIITPPQLKQPLEPVLIPILPQKSVITGATKSLYTGSGAVSRTVVKSPQAIPMLERTASQPQTKKSPPRNIGGQVRMLYDDALFCWIYILPYNMIFYCCW